MNTPAGLIPRQLSAGPLLLDLYHRDAWLQDRWLRLHPREFGLLWRLAESPRTSLSRTVLLRDVWRLRHEPETNTLEVHIFRLRRKLAAHGITGLVVTDPGGGYRLDAEAIPVLPATAASEALDSYLLIGNGERQESQPG
ncbi:winged helix-turn-helix domain-containing protein [Altererythrobacter sp. H2]|uniref:winged helix-turn-helix domain-containing protein n=1 Tax=Altererythrobacter sp. H2 TaxID=3108391 RepID=UPI002B4BB1A3|nr:winged helix-turn-helix domain-containing protein [Altererythrobacter sp. H2]WRK96134.1 winged helix-turn-helix domain-containing protein [Altererythrobacter sp. H2]